MDQINPTPATDNPNPNPVQAPVQPQPAQAYQPPPTETFQPPVQPQPTQPVSPVASPRKSNSFLVMIIVLLLMVIIVGGAFAFYYLNKLKQDQVIIPPTSTTQDEVIVPTIALNVTPSVAEGEVPEGYVLKDTLCYSIAIPQGNDAAQDNDCTLSYRAYINTPTVSDLLVGTGITAEWKEYISLTEMVNDWNTSIKAKEDKVINQESVQVGSVMGQRVLVQNEISSIQSSHVFVYLPNKYTSKGYPVTGFSILTTYSDPQNAVLQKAEEDRLLSSWQWK